MTEYFNTIKDFEQYVSDQPLCNPELYKDDYVEIVALSLLHLCRKKGFEWGQELPELTHEEFWEECFADGEKDKEDEIKLEELVEEHGEIIREYFEEVGCSIDELEDYFTDSYQGEFDSWADFARNMTDDCYDLSGVPEWIRNHIDYESMGNDLSYEYFEINGHFFRS